MTTQQPVKTRSFILVRLQWPGFHRWPDAPDEVGFLGVRHRHVFHMVAEFDVTHADREREFFIQRRAVLDALQETGRDGAHGIEFDTLSCEQIAASVLEKTGARRVVVSEDGENAGGVEVLR